MSITTTTGTAREYRAEVAATGPVSGGTVRVVLGTFRTPHLGTMLRWLTDQAHRVADGLDPAPDARWVLPEHRGALVTTSELNRLPSAADELRAWCADPVGRRAACDRLRAGWPVTVAAVDHTGTYSLWVVPVALSAEVPQRSGTAPTRPCPEPPIRVEDPRSLAVGRVPAETR